MDPDRVRAYLQVACAGLGFDIGEIWWSQSQDGTGSSALMAIEEKHEEEGSELLVSQGKKLRFVQLYTSKSYEDRRNMLVKPADEEENYNNLVNGSKEVEKEVPEAANDDNSKHVLSPLLVDAISKTAQVVWAHTRKQEGLLGRSDIRLQTAVGMPVAVDGSGNMCVVVMFSPNNIQSTDDAMDYLQSISRSATSTSIPALLPAFDPSQGLVSLPHHHPSNEVLPLLSSKCLSDGVVTRFVSLDDAPITTSSFETPEVHSDHDLAAAPKDCFGIPMLPHVSEFGSNVGFSDNGADVFDEASYGVWSTVMDTAAHPTVSALADGEIENPALLTDSAAGATMESDTTPVYAINKPVMPRERRLRLEEFSSAFLEVSVFDFAEVWIPIGAQSDYLGQVTSISSSQTNATINDFTSQSEKILVKFWSGAVGRAFSSGNPVWSANRDVFVDGGRFNLFSKAKIETALAVPVFSGKSTTPSFVFCCYAFVRTGSVPFVLKFVQQALRLLWDGLEKVQPHRSLGEDMWKDVAPADLGEMAADVEMQQHFIIKKRPHHAISPVRQPKKLTLDDTLALQIGGLSKPSGTTEVRSIYTGSSPVTGPTEVSHDLEPNPFASYQIVQDHIQDAVRAVGDMQPVHQHISTNEQGSKRAHVYAPVDVSHQPPAYATNPGASSPLPMPRPLPLPKQILVQPSNPRTSSSGSAPNAGNQTGGHAQGTATVFVTTTSQYQTEGSQPRYAQVDGSQAQQPLYVQQQGQPQPIQSGYTQQTYQQQPASQQQSQSQSVENGYTQQTYQQQPSQQPYGQQQAYEPTSQASHAKPPTQNSQTEYVPEQQQQHHQNVQTGYQQQQNTYVQQQQPAQNGYVQQPHQQQQQHQQTQPVYAQQQQPQGGYSQQPPAQNGYQQQQQQQQPTQNGYAQPPTQNGYPQQHAPQNNYVQVQPAQNGYQPQAGQTVFVAQTNQNGYIQQQSQPQTSQVVYAVQGSPHGQVQQGAPQNYQTSAPYAAPSSGDAIPVPTTVSSIPTHQLSATGITLPAGTPTVSNGLAMVGQGGQYCIPTNQAPVGFPNMAASGKPCRIQGCNEMCAARRPYCVRHSGNRMCEHDGCNKCAQGSTRFCIAHGGGRRCTHPGCDKGARDKFFCAAHGGGKRCKADGCNKSAVGGSSLCTAHGGGRRCSVDGCDKSAQSSTKFCVKHGGGKKCCHPDCEKVARGRTQYCAAHGGGVRCKLEGCNRVAIGKLQLCRAHGGGARARGKKQSAGEAAHAENEEPMQEFREMESFGMESV